MPAISTSKAQPKATSYQEIYLSEAKIRENKKDPNYLADLKSLSTKASLGNEQILFDCANDNNILKSMYSAFGKQVFEFSPLLLSSLKNMSTDKQTLVQAYLSNSKNSQDISIRTILKENPFKILNNSSDKFIPSISQELVDMNFTDDALNAIKKESHIYDNDYISNKKAIIQKTITEGTFDTIFNALGGNFFLHADSSNIKLVHNLLKKGMDKKILTTLGEKFFTHLGYDSQHLPELITSGNFDKVWNALGKEFFIKETYNSSRGKPEVRAPNGFCSQVVKALELRIFDEMVKTLGKNVFISGHIYSVEQVAYAIKAGALEKIHKELGDYFISDFNASRNIQEITDAIKAGTFDTMHKKLDYDFFRDTCAPIKTVSQTVIDKTFDEIIKIFGSGFYKKLGSTSINTVSKLIKDGNFTKVMHKLGLDSNDSINYANSNNRNLIQNIQAVNEIGIPTFNKIVDIMGKDFILNRANSNDIKNIAKLMPT